ncbi:copper resistance CopC family protein [Microbacterium sp. G2-8]|uniref:copper resistance CopC family protein n=1 Tax=Microbacterium sp. G2-8 TaxID=2842454 RepID=UPI001C899D83|nr:copper resistance CopC family protein [Microbacterium sp. G2-8]
MTERTTPLPRSRTRRALALAALIGAAFVAPLAIAAPAAAHSSLVSTTPETDGSVGSPPAEVTLTFSDDLTQPASPGDGTTDVAIYDESCEDAGLIIANPGTADTRDCRDYADGDPVVDGPRVTQAVDTADAPAGTYTVIWRVLYGDGHADSQMFTFTAEQPTSPEVTPTASPTDAPQDPTESAAPSEDSGDDAGLSAPVVIAIVSGIVLLLLVAFIVWMIVRSRRS